MKFVLFVIITFLIIAGGAVIISFPNSLPGDLTYPVKGVYENLKLAFNELSIVGRAGVFIDLSNERLKEFEKLVLKKDYSRVDETLNQMVLMEKKALASIEKAKDQGTNVTLLLSSFESSLQKQQDTVRRLYFDLTPDSYENSDRIVDSIQQSLDRVKMLRQ